MKRMDSISKMFRDSLFYHHVQWTPAEAQSWPCTSV